MNGVFYIGASGLEAQQRALDILQFKLDILWTMLDSIEKAFPQ